MSDMKVLEVRCCCAPDKLVGYIEVPADMERGDEVVLPTGSFLPIERFCRVRYLDDGTGRRIEKSYLAVKSENVPIEKLLQCPGFREATTRERDKDEVWYLDEDLEPVT